MNKNYISKCSDFLENEFNKKVLMVSSGTAALELSAYLLNINKNDEVIVPSYTYISTASAFAKFGATIKFVDIKSIDMNIDEKKIEAAITKKTKAIIAVHYNGVPCNMDKIIKISKKYNLKIVEDNAQGAFVKYKNKYLGTFGDYGCFSFQKLKNFNCSEGGAITLNTEEEYAKALDYINCGSNRYDFYNNKVQNYSWQFVGSNYRMNEIAAKVLYKQFLHKNKIIKKRISLWNKYYNYLHKYYNCCSFCGSANNFFIICENDEQKKKLINKYKLTTHFYPALHNTKAGKQFGKFIGQDKNTTKLSNLLLRLPMDKKQQRKIIKGLLNERNNSK